MNKKSNNQKMTIYEVHNALFEILEEVDRILTYNGIPYYLMFGTLLGCVREGSPIKWDDDIDICVRAQDWDRMNALLMEHLDYDRFFLLNKNTKIDYPDGRFITRVGMNGTYRRMDYYKDSSNNSGIFIDIFILVDVSECTLAQKIWDYELGVIDGIVNLHSFCKGSYSRPFFLSSLLYYLTRNKKDVVFWCELRRRIQNRFIDERTSHVTVPFGPFGVYPLKKTYYEAKDFLAVKKSPFSVKNAYGEVVKTGYFSIPIGYEGILKKTYGDWHKRPKGRRMPGVSFWEAKK